MKKIMFNDRYGLTTAVLEGRKTMTRRIVNLNRVPTLIPGRIDECLLKYAPYKVGEVVAVAQAYKDTFGNPGLLFSDWPGWSNKMFVRADLMPHHIRITGIRVERLRDITEEDCLREGIYKSDTAPGVRALFAYDTMQDQDGHMLATTWYTTARGAFSGLIDKVSGKGTWGDNPWAFVYEFELVEE